MKHRGIMSPTLITGQEQDMNEVKESPGAKPRPNMGDWRRIVVQYQQPSAARASWQIWDYAAAALQGSSFYKLPRVLQWFSGNIGFHHIHHLSPRIPNYNLEKCHRAEPLFQTVKPVTLFSSFKSFSFRLWDEQRRRLVGYRALKAIRNQRGQAGA